VIRGALEARSSKASYLHGALAPPYQRAPLHPFLVANKLIHGSYVSLYSALAFHGVIPEAVFTVTSVSHRRGSTFHTLLGDFVFRNVKRELVTGYAAHALGGQKVYVAAPEKALADLIHLTPHADDPVWLDAPRPELSLAPPRGAGLAVVRNLEVIGEATKQLPADLRAKAPEVEWQKVAGLRDVLIHAYFGVDVSHGDVPFPLHPAMRRKSVRCNPQPSCCPREASLGAT
jgi:hypothetical protein